MAHNKAQEPFPFKVSCGILTATTTCSYPAPVPYQRGEVLSIYIKEQAGITGDNTNRYSFSFNKGTIASPTAIATLDLVTGTDLTANVPLAVSLAAIASATCRVTTTDVLHVVATKNGSAGNTVNLEVNFMVSSVYDHGSERT